MNVSLSILQFYGNWSAAFGSRVPPLHLCSPLFEREGKAKGLVILAKISDGKCELSQLPAHRTLSRDQSLGTHSECRACARLAPPRGAFTHPTRFCEDRSALSSKRHPGDPETNKARPLSCRSSKTSGEMGTGHRKLLGSMEEARGTHVPARSRREAAQSGWQGQRGGDRSGCSEDLSLQLRGTNQTLRASSLAGQNTQHILHPELGSGFSH